MPLGNKGSSSGWELKLLWPCPLEDQFGKGKGFGKLLVELVLSSFQRGFLSLWIFLSLQELSGSEFLIRDLGPAQIRGNTGQEKPSQECPKENQTQKKGEKPWEAFPKFWEGPIWKTLPGVENSTKK